MPREHNKWKRNRQAGTVLNVLQPPYLNGNARKQIQKNAFPSIFSEKRMSLCILQYASYNTGCLVQALCLRGQMPSTDERVSVTHIGKNFALIIRPKKKKSPVVGRRFFCKRRKIYIYSDYPHKIGSTCWIIESRLRDTIAAVDLISSL